MLLERKGIDTSRLSPQVALCGEIKHRSMPAPAHIGAYCPVRTEVSTDIYCTAGTTFLRDSQDLKHREDNLFPAGRRRIYTVQSSVELLPQLAVRCGCV